MITYHLGSKALGVVVGGVQGLGLNVFATFNSGYRVVVVSSVELLSAPLSPALLSTSSDLSSGASSLGCKPQLLR